MHCVRALSVLVLVLAARTALASCGSESCPLDRAATWHEAKFSLDLSQQYIDQDQPRSGTEDVAVGAIPSEHDEVRMLNRSTTVSLGYRPGGAWALLAAMPYVSRYHEHIHNHDGGSELQRWNYSGIGDLELLATRFFGPAEGNARYFARAGVKAPTGDTSVPEVDGDQPEPPSRPGTGSWDLSAGTGAEWRVAAPAAGEGREMPIRLNVTARFPGAGTDDYRVGSELMAHAGTEYPVAGPAAAFLQMNFRARAKDDVGTTDEEPDNTGGTWLYLSPGARMALDHRSSIYGLVQIPVYQDVNGIQLVAKANLYVGISRSVF